MSRRCNVFWWILFGMYLRYIVDEAFFPERALPLTYLIVFSCAVLLYVKGDET